MLVARVRVGDATAGVDYGPGNASILTTPSGDCVVFAGGALLHSPKACTLQLLIHKARVLLRTPSIKPTAATATGAAVSAGATASPACVVRPYERRGFSQALGGVRRILPLKMQRAARQRVRRLYAAQVGHDHPTPAVIAANMRASRSLALAVLVDESAQVREWLCLDNELVLQKIRHG